MKYQEIYNRLVESRKNRRLEFGVYYEKHHVLPKSLGGSNDKSNLVHLLPREHFLAHLLLVKIYEDDIKSKTKMSTALWMMCNSRKHVTSARQYEYVRLLYTETSKGKNTWMKGRKLPDEVKQKISIKLKGRICSEEMKEKMSKILVGNTRSKGYKHSDIAKQKISKSQIGHTRSKDKPWSELRRIAENNIERRKVIQMDLNGNELNIFNSVSLAAETLGIGRNGISRVCRGEPKRKTYKGFIWKYKD